MAPYGGSQLAASFRTVRGNTIRIAEEIPDEQYDREIAPGMMTIRQTLSHLAFSPAYHHDIHQAKGLTSLVGYDWGAMLGTLHTETNRARSKAELLDLLRTRGEETATWLASLDDATLATMVTDGSGQIQKSRLELLLSIKEHEMHHRGQLMVAQRQLGLVPHTTRAMQERMAARAAATN